MINKWDINSTKGYFNQIETNEAGWAMCVLDASPIKDVTNMSPPLKRA